MRLHFLTAIRSVLVECVEFRDKTIFQGGRCDTFMIATTNDWLSIIADEHRFASGSIHFRKLNQAPDSGSIS